MNLWGPHSHQPAAAYAATTLVMSEAFWNVVEWMSKPGLLQCQASAISPLTMLYSDLPVIPPGL